MRGTNSALAATALVVAAFAAGEAQAAKDYWLDIEGGIEFDDNVAVDQTDTNGRAGDTAATFELDAGYKLVDTPTSRVEVSYDFFQSVYQDTTSFNYQSHTPTLNAWTKFDNFKIGGSYSYTHSMLGNYFFFDEHELTPTATYYFSDTLYLTGYLRYRNRNYDRANDEARDGHTWQPGADLYIYFDKEDRGFFSVGGGYTNEETKGSRRAILPSGLADEFDYTGFSARASVQVPIELFGLPGRTRLSYAYQNRDYDNPHPDILIGGRNVARSDDRNTLRGLVELRLTDDLKAAAEYRRVDRSSNLPTADYTENIGDFTLRYSF